MGSAAGLDGNESELARLMRAAIAGDERAYGEFLRRVACFVRLFVLLRRHAGPESDRR